MNLLMKIQWMLLGGASVSFSEGHLWYGISLVIFSILFGYFGIDLQTKLEMIASKKDVEIKK